MSRQGISRQVADAVAAEINVQDWDIAFTAKRSRGDFSLALPKEATTGFRCDVVQVTYDDTERDNFDSLVWPTPIHVVFRKLLAQGDRNEDGSAKNEIVDPLEAVAEDVFAHFFKIERLPTFEDAALEYAPRWLTLYGIFNGSGEGGTLRTLGQFTSGFELRFEVCEDLS